jgi:septum formation protein
MTRTLILASASPRRQAFLTALNLTVTVKVADIDETPRPEEEPVALARRLAGEKAATVARLAGDAHPGALIIAADTVVAQGRALLGKPATPTEAVQMLRTLRAAPHQVVSAVCVHDVADGRTRTVANVTQVTMRAYTDAEIDAYVATGDPMDKAGAYAIQHAAFNPVAAMTGCFTGVMGLPLGDFVELLAEFGVAVAQPVGPICLANGAESCCRSAPA